MTGSNRRPSACKADALPAELILHIYAWRRPTLTGGKPQLPSALRSLTSVFGMGTGVTFSLSSPNYLIRRFVLSKLDNAEEEMNHFVINLNWLSPRPISICQLHVSPRFHPKPINLIIFQGSY